MKKHNFSAGPSILSPYTIQHTAEGVLDLDQSGLSVMEISHRSKEFMAIMEETQQLFRDLLDIPSGYSVLLLQGGASMQFCMVPMNLLANDRSADYVDTGTWSTKAINEAGIMKKDIKVVASSADKGYAYIPKNISFNSDAAYTHITSNNTIKGTQWKDFPDTAGVPLIADMSSDIFCRPIDMAPFGLIYAGAQKNIGPAGVCMVIIRDDMLDRVPQNLPAMLKYTTYAEKNSTLR